MAGQDPYLDNVSLLLNFDGGFADLITGAVLPPLFGASVQSADKKYGISAPYFNGALSSGCPCIALPTDAVNFGTAPFTIEFWIKSLSGAASSAPIPLCLSYGDVLLYFIIGGAGTVWGSTGRVTATIKPLGGSISYPYNSAVIKDSGAWHHVALERDANGVRIAIDGTFGSYAGGSAAGSGNFYNTMATRCTLGAFGNDTGIQGDKCYIDDLRITKNVARYSSDFTPPGRLTVLSYPDTRAAASPIAGTATDSAGDAVDSIAVHHWDTKGLAALVVPEESGAWSADVPPGDYEVTAFVDGCQPFAHGPYTVE